MKSSVDEHLVMESGALFICFSCWQVIMAPYALAMLFARPACAPRPEGLPAMSYLDEGQQAVAACGPRAHPHCMAALTACREHLSKGGTT